MWVDGRDDDQERARRILAPPRKLAIGAVKAPEIKRKHTILIKSPGIAEMTCHYLRLKHSLLRFDHDLQDRTRDPRRPRLPPRRIGSSSATILDGDVVAASGFDSL